MEKPRTTMSSLAANFVNCSLGYAPGGGTPDTTIPHWVTFWLCFCIKLYCWSQVSASSLSLIGVFAVTDAGTSGSLINSVATSVFPSDCCNKDNKRTRPRKPVITFILKQYAPLCTTYLPILRLRTSVIFLLVHLTFIQITQIGRASCRERV